MVLMNVFAGQPFARDADVDNRSVDTGEAEGWTV